MSATYINPALPGMIRNLWKSDPSENSVRTALKLAGDLVQELIDIRAANMLREPERTSRPMTNQSPESMVAEARGFWGSETREYTEGLVSRLADALEAAEARLKVLEAQVASIGVINPAGAAKLDERPDDSESDQLIAEADSFVDAIWEIGEKYEVPLTNNMERWQEGVFLRHAGDFAADVSDAAQRFIAKPLEARIAELEAGEWEYGVKWHDGLDPVWYNPYTVDEAEKKLADWPKEPGYVVRRRKAGPWLPVDGES